MLGHACQQGITLDWTFYCALGRQGELDDKARSLGARVILSPAPIGSKATFVRALRTELLRGEYGVLHCHHDLVSAVYLAAAMKLPIQRRIVHVHNADEEVLTPHRLKQRLYREPMRRACLALADHIVGISGHTLDTFLAGRARRPGRDIVHYYGVDSTPFENLTTDRRLFRHQLDLPENSLILLFAGRLVPEKNPAFAIDVLASLRRVEPRAVAVFAGAGSQEQRVLSRAHELSVGDSVRLLGWRDDLPEILSCSDWFILPRPEHPMEGFSLAVVEAQLAGLRLLLSRGIPDDPLLPTARFQRLALADGPEHWARAAMELLNLPASSSADALATLKESPMNMNRALKSLLALHA